MWPAQATGGAAELHGIAVIVRWAAARLAVLGPVGADRAAGLARIRRERDRGGLPPGASGAAGVSVLVRSSGLIDDIAQPARDSGRAC